MFDQFADVSVPLPISETYTYRIPEGASVSRGELVTVLFNGRIIDGIVTEIHGRDPGIKTEILEPGTTGIVVTDFQIELSEWMAQEYFCGPGEALFRMFPAGRPPKKKRAEKPANAPRGASHKLNAEQESAFDSVIAQKGVDHLLLGITGSGKTEVYIHLLARVLEEGRSAMLLVPEISLTVQMIRRLSDAFGDDVALLHSGLASGKRWSAYLSLLNGQRRLAVGTRSAIFAPVKDPALIIIDEEHDSSYREHSGSRYDARRIASRISQQVGSTTVMGSATPRIETRYKTKQTHVLTKRATGAQLSRVDIVQATDSDISPVLFDALKEAHGRKEQSILLLNRRGYFPYLYCKSCKETIQCPRCSVTLPLHRNGLLICHYCAYSRADNSKCDRCGGKIQRLGVGTQRVEEVILSLFPTARIERLDTDSASGKVTADTIDRFLAGEIDILVGTQMIAKGLDSPNVTLVGVLRADQGMAMPDFRAGERSFALLTQVAGRAGRAQRPGRVIFEALNPENKILALAAKHDYDSFYESEIADRKASMYPPFCSLTRLLMRSVDEARSMSDAEYARAILSSELPPESEILGPAPAPIYKISDQYRTHIIIKTQKSDLLHDLLASKLPEIKKRIKSHLEIELDAVDLL